MLNFGLVFLYLILCHEAKIKTFLFVPDWKVGASMLLVCDFTGSLNLPPIRT